MIRQNQWPERVRWRRWAPRLFHTKFIRFPHHVIFIMHRNKYISKLGGARLTKRPLLYSKKKKINIFFHIFHARTFITLHTQLRCPAQRRPINWSWPFVTNVRPTKQLSFSTNCPIRWRSKAKWPTPNNGIHWKSTYSFKHYWIWARKVFRTALQPSQNFIKFSRFVFSNTAKI